MRCKVILVSIITAVSLQSLEKNGSPIAYGPGDQTEAQLIISEEKDYFYVIYSDFKGGGIQEYKIFCAKVNSKTGELLWSSPVPACKSDSGMWQPTAVGTPSGKVIIAFLDGRKGYGKYRLYISKIGPTGNWEWSPKAASVCTVDNAADHPQLCLDGSGEGAYVCWEDCRSAHLEVWAAGVSQEGKVVFEKKVREGSDPVIVPSGESCIVFWLGKEGDTVGIYGQRISPQGEFLWKGPRLIIPEYGWLKELQRLPLGVPYSYAVSDMKGGALAYYYKGPERVDSLGNRYRIYSTFGPPVFHHLISDGASGLLGTIEGGGGEHQYILVSHIDSLGKGVWGKEKVVWENPYEDTADSPKGHPTVAGDHKNGCVIVWSAVWVAFSPGDILLQRIDSLGNIVWRDPIVVCEVGGMPQNPFVIEGPDDGWWIIWEDKRNGNWDIYAAFIDSSGKTGVKELDEGPLTTDIKLFSSNPFTEMAEIVYQIPYPGIVNLRVYDVQGRLIKGLVDEKQSPGVYRVFWDGNNMNNRNVPNGIYFYQLSIKGKNDSTQIIRKVVLFKKGK